MFLAAPLLTTTGLYEERKFSGSDEAGNNIDTIGRTIDAYAHHILVDSGGTFLMTDLQGTAPIQIFYRSLTLLGITGVVGPDKEVILFDPQAHSSEENTGFWDGGAVQMREWLKAHKCKDLCRRLGLKDSLVEIKDKEVSAAPSKTGPLRYGFPSPKHEEFD